MFHDTPRCNISNSAFRDQDVDVRVPLKTTPKGMQNANKSGREVFGLIDFAKHIQNCLANGIKKTVQKISVFEKKYSELLGNRKNTMPMS